MPKVLQYRCPSCLKLLIKWERGANQCVFQAEGIEFVEQQGTKKKDVVCPKCGTRAEITTRGLRKVELVEV